MTEVHASCDQGLDRIVGLQARSEVYMGHVGQALCFLPGVPWVQIGRRVLPEADIQELTTCIRRVARLLWAVHLSFQQGFDAVSPVPTHLCFKSMSSAPLWDKCF